MLKSKNRFQNPGSTRCRFSMTDLRLDRSDGAPCAPTSRRLVNLHQTGDFRRVTNLCSRSVRFDQFNRIGRNPGHAIGVVKTTNLPFRLRCIDCVACSITGCSNPFQDCVNLVAIAFGISLSFEDKHADTFTENRPIRLV